MKKGINKIFLIIILYSVLLNFCTCVKKEIVPPSNLGYEYFPVKTGHWVIYNVDSINYNSFTSTVDTFKYQIKEYIESNFKDNLDRNCQRIERYYRKNDTTKWRLTDVQYSVNTSTTAEKTIDNITYIKLTFPVRTGSKWNGNAYNSLGEQQYIYKSANASYKIGLLNFDSTVSVLQKYSVNAISKDSAAEIYAKNIGLIYKKVIHLTKKSANGNIESGYDYKYTIHSYSK